jgi:hypothetical protein
MTTERVLVACNAATIGGQSAGLPAAIVAVAPSYKDKSYRDGGYDDLWSATASAEDFFEAIGTRGPNAPGLWVLEQEYEEPDGEREEWTHLLSGKWRTLTEEEWIRLKLLGCPFEDGRLA